MDLIRLHRDELLRSLQGPAWHGPALLETLADVTPAEAFARPVSGIHSIAELVAHTLAWMEEVTRRLQGGDPALPQRGDWPAPAEQSSASWTDLTHLLKDAARGLDEALSRFAPERLLETVGGPQADPPLGTGVSHAAMLHGLAQHNAYHGGQIALLKHAIRRGSPPPE